MVLNCWSYEIYFHYQMFIENLELNLQAYRFNVVTTHVHVSKYVFINAL